MPRRGRDLTQLQIFPSCADTDSALLAIQDSGFRTLRGEYPAFEAPSYAPPSSVCDAMVAPCSATGDGHADDTHALQSCIERCDRDKDGRFAVLLRRGHSFLSGALNMSSGPCLACPPPLPALECR